VFLIYSKRSAFLRTLCILYIQYKLKWSHSIYIQDKWA